MSWGFTVSAAGMSYVQDNIGWPVVFGACWATMLVSLLVFLLGTGTYRPEQPRRARTSFAATTTDAVDTTSLLTPPVTRGADKKGVVAKLLQIWITSSVYAVVVCQMGTLCTKQGSTMDRRIVIDGGLVVVVPPAALQSLVSLTIMVSVPVYDRAVVPLARRATGHPSGITTLQRVGAGMATACLAKAVAAPVEAARLRRRGAAAPMSLWWIVPQYALVGVASVLTLVGLEEFFYDQVPGELRSVGLAASMSVLSVGSYASGLLVSAIDWATRSRGGERWFSDNLKFSTMATLTTSTGFWLELVL